MRRDLDDEVWLTDRELRELCGGISAMALWRWRHSPRVAFPMPDTVIGGRNYTAMGKFRAWRAQRTAAAKDEHQPGPQALGMNT